MLTFILHPYSRVNTENPYPILDLFPDLLFPESRSLLQSKIRTKMIPYSRPKRFDFYTLFESTAAHTYKAHIWEYPPPRPPANCVKDKVLIDENVF